MTVYRLTIRRDYLYEGVGTIVGAGYGSFTNKDNVFLVQKIELTVPKRGHSL